MDWTRKSKLMIRWSLLTAGLIALFWTIWYLCAGSVPEVSSVKMTPDWTVALPFAISRWWNILLGPICSVIIILLLTSKKIREDENLGAGLGLGVVVGVVFGVVFGVGAGVDAGVGAGVVVGVVVGVVFGVVVGVVVGVGAGVVFGVVFGVVVGVVVGVGVLLKYLFSRTFWLAVGRWLMAK